MAAAKKHGLDLLEAVERCVAVVVAEPVQDEDLVQLKRLLHELGAVVIEASSFEAFPGTSSEAREDLFFDVDVAVSSP